MKKIMLLVPLILLFSVENVDAMYRKSMKKMYARKSGRKHRKNVNKLAKRKKKIRRKKVSKKKKLNLIDGLIDSLFVPIAPKKIFSVRPFVSSIDFSFANKNLISKILLFYLILCQILGNQPAFCLYAHNQNVGAMNRDMDMRLGKGLNTNTPIFIQSSPQFGSTTTFEESTAIFNRIQSSVDASFARSRENQANWLKQQGEKRKKEETERTEQLRKENERRRREEKEATQRLQQQKEERMRAKAKAISKRVKEEEDDTQQYCDPSKEADVSMVPTPYQVYAFFEGIRKSISGSQ
ncbi:hypothetical protein ACFLYU_04475 [Candidatus Dependentiae bacterium]